MFEIKKIGVDEADRLKALIADIENSLPDKLFWLPIKEKEEANFFNDEWTYFVGVFDREDLVAAAALFFNEFEFGDSLRSIGVERELFPFCAEIGRCMVKPSCRGMNFMSSMIEVLAEEARTRGKKYLIATAHPQNTASRRSLEKAGMKKIAETIKCGIYPRCIYMMKA